MHGGVRAGLPALGTPLIGRDIEMADLRMLLRQRRSRLVTLIGPGGTGKSTLAVALATELAPDFAGGAWFVDLTAIHDPRLLSAAIAQTLGVRETASAALADALVQRLAEQPTLLVLDNFEHVFGAAGDVASLLAVCHDLVIIVTSREALALRVEHIYGVGTLGVPDITRPAALPSVADAASVALFVDRAAARRGGFALTNDNFLTVAEICVRLDGLPLAIELAAAQTGMLSPQAVLGRLRADAPFLVGGPRDLPIRQQTLEALVAWSYELLSEVEQAIFRWCGVFIGGFTADAIEAVHASNDPHMDVLGSLVQLATKSLVQVTEGVDDEPRFRLLGTIRSYAVEQLRQRGEWDVARTRHAEYYVALAERLQPGLRGPNAASTLEQLAREYDNFRAVFNLSSETDNLELGLRLAGPLYRFWHLRGYLAEPRQWLDGALSRAECVAPEVRAAALHAAGLMAAIQRDNARATELFEASLTLWTQLDDVRRMMRSSQNLGLVAHDMHDLTRALELLQQAEALAVRTGDRFGLASAIGAQGRVANEQGRPDEARRLSERSIELFREVGDKEGIAATLANLGHMMLDQRDPEHASACFREALELRRALGSPMGIAECLEAFAAACVERQPRRATRLLGAALALRQRSGAGQSRPEREQFDRTRAHARTRLAERTFETEWVGGQSMTVQAAMELALGPDEAFAAEPNAPLPGVGAAFELSAREREVAQLIAQGRSNREIAAALVVSTKTVESHIKHIFDKLGVQGRAEIAVWATRRGLVPDHAA